MDRKTLQFTDPEITRLKYEKELDGFYSLETFWREKGIFLIKDDCPKCEFLFLPPKGRPIAPYFSVRIDYSNFDAAPPSVQFIHPFTGRQVKRLEIPFQFKQKITQKQADELGITDASEGIDICISIGDEPPFLCHPGTKEYHEHPLHDGHSWWLNRGSEGRLYRLLHLLYSTSLALYENLVVTNVINGRVPQILTFQKKP